MKTNKTLHIIFISMSLLLLQFPEATVAGRTTDARGERSFIHRQKKALNKSEELFLKGDYRGVIKICDDILYLSRRYPSGKRYMDKLYYLGGISYLRLGNTVKAKSYLNKIISQYKRSQQLVDAYLALAEAYFMDEEYTEATNLLIHYTRTYPTDSSIPQAYLRLGQIAQKSGRWEESRFYFDMIKKDFPLSFEAALISSYSDEDEFFFTVQLGSFNNLDNARKLKRRLEGMGYSPYIVEIRNSKTTFYRVRIGKLKSRTEAEYLADKLKKQGLEAKVYP